MAILSSVQLRANRLKSRGALVLDYLWSSRAARAKAPLFEGVERFCLFVGYPRSGHSLTGALLDAHPRMLVAHELNALKYLRAGFSEAQLYALLLRRDEEFIAAGSVWSGYSYAVPGQWQGRWEGIRVIGDKMGGMVAAQLKRWPEMIGKVEAMFGDRLRLIHHVRNPYDNIATMYKYRLHGGGLNDYVRQYFNAHCVGVDAALKAWGDRVYTTRHEDFIADPRGTLRTLCGFLGEDAPEDYLDACAALVFPSAKKTRHSAPWTAAELEAVEQGIRRYPFLQGYTFES